jgi:hypothetical protein
LVNKISLYYDARSKKHKKMIVVFWDMATLSWIDTDVSNEAAYPSTDCYIPKAAVFVIT